MANDKDETPKKEKPAVVSVDPTEALIKQIESLYKKVNPHALVHLQAAVDHIKRYGVKE
jgi:hypothetical protein